MDQVRAEVPLFFRAAGVTVLLAFLSMPVGRRHWPGGRFDPRVADPHSGGRRQHGNGRRETRPRRDHHLHRNHSRDAAGVSNCS